MIVRHGAILLINGASEFPLAMLAEIALPDGEEEITEVENILAAVTAAWALGLTPDLISDGIKRFHGSRAHATPLADAEKANQRNRALELPC